MNADSSRVALAGVPEMQGARPESLEILAAAAEFAEVPAGVELYAQHSAADVVFVVLEGSVQLGRSDATGQSTVLETRRTPCLVGEAAGLNGGARTVTAVAVEALTGLRIATDRWRTCLAADPALGLGLARRLATTLRRSSTVAGTPATVPEFMSVMLPVAYDDIAPDRSWVRILARLPQGSMAHFELGPQEVSVAQRHRTVSEIWYVLSGLGVMWREQEDLAAKVDLRPGLSLTIPVGTSFQFKNTGRVPLAAIGVTMPPWPGKDEATDVTGPWAPSCRA